MKSIFKKLTNKFIFIALLPLLLSCHGDIKIGLYESINLESQIISIEIQDSKTLVLNLKNRRVGPLEYQIDRKSIEFPYGPTMTRGLISDDKKSIQINGNTYKQGPLEFVMPDQYKNMPEAQEVEKEINLCAAKAPGRLDSCMIANGLSCCKR